MLLVANLMLFFHVRLTTQIVMVVLFLLPLLAAARWRTALNFGVTYAVLTTLGLLDPDTLGLPWLHVVSALAVGVTDLHNVHTVADHCQTNAQRRRRTKQHGAVRSGDFQTTADMFTGFD